MNSSATTTISNNIYARHGKFNITEPADVMDIHLSDQARNQHSTQSDVVDTLNDLQKIESDVRTQSQEQSSFSSPPLESQGTQTVEWTPLRFGQMAHKLSQPHTSQDLLSLYGLSPLVASVARTNAQGEKINKMRRSYEGQVKAFGLAGRNKAIRVEPGEKGSFAELLAWPEEEWQNQKVMGKEISKGLSLGSIARLEKAMKMEPGAVPKNDEWENILGHEKLKTTIPNGEQKGKQPLHAPVKISKVNGRTNGVPSRVGTPSANEAARPKRVGKKRRYDEHSFEGYGEGFVDDDGDPLDHDGYTSGEGSRKSSVSKKKRKKDYRNPPSMPDRVGSYGVGMIGVGGVSSYGR